jgi:rhodanese-related sulfurtransferase
MGGSQSIRRINYEDMQEAYKKTDIYIIINTLSPIMQECLIFNTTSIETEELIINKYLTTNRSISIIIYGMNSNDETTIHKYNQLTKLGFKNIYIYSGGLFEWLLLQDIYGYDFFPTNKKNVDFIKYKGKAILHIPLLQMQ